jgi:hypothetical protein
MFETDNMKFNSGYNVPAHVPGRTDEGQKNASVRVWVSLDLPDMKEPTAVSRSYFAAILFAEQTQNTEFSLV